jgi:hypothetical protein
MSNFSNSHDIFEFQFVFRKENTRKKYISSALAGGATNDPADVARHV